MRHTAAQRPALRRLRERLTRQLDPAAIPRHVGVISTATGGGPGRAAPAPATATRRAPTRSSKLLTWCDEVGVEVVTLWLLSTDNLNRPEGELGPLLGIIEEAVEDLAADAALAAPPGRRARPPARRDRRSGSRRPRSAPATSTGMLVNVAVGYGGRREIADAVRSLLHEHADARHEHRGAGRGLDVEHIAEHLYTKGQPDPDLVIRTSGEQRLSGFLLWQSAHSEFYFCEAYWPDFRKVDFLRALRAYGERDRRFGG